MKKYNAIIGLSFGTGISNMYLAGIVDNLKKQQPDIKVILQKEIAKYYKEDLLEGKDLIIKEHRVKGKYLDTWEVLDQAQDFILESKKTEGIDKWNEVLLVCHPDHLPRSVKTAKILGFRPSQGVVPERDIPYDPNSEQWWTRSRWVFAVWELGAWVWLHFKISIDKYF